MAEENTQRKRERERIGGGLYSRRADGRCSWRKDIIRSKPVRNADECIDLARYKTRSRFDAIANKACLRGRTGSIASLTVN